MTSGEFGRYCNVMTLTTLMNVLPRLGDQWDALPQLRNIIERGTWGKETEGKEKQRDAPQCLTRNDASTPSFQNVL